ncbi:hypothetical protein Hanom_Chr09g00864521 [Helianthus anomalus]
MGGCSRTSCLQNPSRLSVVHKGRFKGNTRLSCNTRLTRFHRGILSILIHLHSCARLWETFVKMRFSLDILYTKNVLCVYIYIYIYIYIL